MADDKLLSKYNNIYKPNVKIIPPVQPTNLFRSTTDQALSWARQFAQPHTFDDFRRIPVIPPTPYPEQNRIGHIGELEKNQPISHYHTLMLWKEGYHQTTFYNCPIFTCMHRAFKERPFYFNKPENICADLSHIHINYHARKNFSELKCEDEDGNIDQRDDFHDTSDNEIINNIHNRDDRITKHIYKMPSEKFIYRRPAVAGMLWNPIGIVRNGHDVEVYANGSVSFSTSIRIETSHYSQHCKNIFFGDVRQGSKLWFVFTRSVESEIDYKKGCLNIVPIATFDDQFITDYKFFEMYQDVTGERYIPTIRETTIKQFGVVTAIDAWNKRVNNEHLRKINQLDEGYSLEETKNHLDSIPEIEVMLTI